MRVAVLKEIESGEKRVAIIPETVKRLVKKGVEVGVEYGAGEGSCFRDEEYEEAGATIEPSAEALLAATDVIIKIQRPTPEEILKIREGTTIISFLYPLINLDLVNTLAGRKITAIAVDSIPRTTLAQMMDVLSSQATIAGYYAVIMAAYALPKFFPMLMTAAGGWKAFVPSNPFIAFRLPIRCRHDGNLAYIQKDRRICMLIKPRLLPLRHGVF